MFFLINPNFTVSEKNPAALTRVSYPGDEMNPARNPQVIDWITLVQPSHQSRKVYRL